MAIETSFNYPSDLNASNPLGGDFRRDGDNHIRGIKNVLKTTFPNINGAMNASQAELNVLAGLGTTWAVVYPGMIMMWSGTIATIPTGYVLCDGTNSTPDLRDRFVVGAKQDDAGAAKTNVSGSLSQTGGSISATSDSQGAHTHSLTVDNHTLTEAEMPAHTHSARAVYTGAVQGGGGYNVYGGLSATGSTGGSTGHNHTASSDSQGAHTHTISTLSPYYALAFIMKT